MHKEDNVYTYVIDSVSDILEQGISYYANKDSDLQNQLITFYEFIRDNNQVMVEDESEKMTVEELLVSDNSNGNDRESNCDNLNDESAKEIKALTDSFMGKMTDIKISVLNLENDLSLYHSNLTEDTDQTISDIELYSSDEEDLEATGVIEPISIVDINLDDNLLDESRPETPEEIEKEVELPEVSSPKEEVIEKNDNDSEDGDLVKKSIFDIFKKK